MYKGQAAMEFLITYGWAILVVLAAIGALAYFGVLSPGRFLPEKCTLPSGIACLDHNYVSSTGFTFVLKNGLGYDISGVSVALDGTGCANTTATPVAVSLTNGGQQNFVVACTGLTGKFQGDLGVTYTNSQSGLIKTVRGEIISATS